MSRLRHFLGRGAAAGLAFAALSAPSVAGASTIVPFPPSTVVIPFSGSVGPITYWAVLPYGAGFNGPNSNCSFQTTESLILPPHAQCTVNGHTIGVFFFPSGPLFVFT